MDWMLSQTDGILGFKIFGKRGMGRGRTIKSPESTSSIRQEGADRSSAQQYPLDGKWQLNVSIKNKTQGLHIR